MSSLSGRKILVIDDDIFIRGLVEESLRQDGAVVHTAVDGHDGLRRFYELQPELVILDVMMPGLTGWEVCRQIRVLSEVPIIMLTSLSKEDDIVRGLDYGAIDYVTKPFSTKILRARVRVALRQPLAETSGGRQTAVFQDQRLKIDLDEHRVWIDGEVVKLTKTEYQLLAYLVQNAGIVLTLQQILEKVWGWEYQESVEYVHVYISRLRQKLEVDPKNPRYLLTEYGIGYRFEKL